MTRKRVSLLTTTIVLLLSAVAYAQKIPGHTCTAAIVEGNIDAFAPLTQQNAIDLCRLALRPSVQWRADPLSDGSEGIALSDSEIEHPEEPDPDAKSFSFAPKVMPLDPKYRPGWLHDLESIQNKE